MHQRKFTRPKFMSFQYLKKTQRIEKYLFNENMPRNKSIVQ